MDQLKVCSCCKVTKEKKDFYVDKSSFDNLSYHCKNCVKNRTLSWQVLNKDKVNKKNAKWKRVNKSKVQASGRIYYEKNKEKMYAYDKAWKKRNPAKMNAKCAKRNAKKLNATPPWLTKAQLKEIAQIYKQAKILEEQTKKKFHVDHIIPLQGKDVCGLHVPWNLQILTAEENIKKGNRL